MKKNKRTLPPGGKGPLYKQLANLIHTEISQGVIPPESSLPTVRDLAQEMMLSAGTVMHAYDELERLGIIEKVRGRGTFVCLQNNALHDKKERAMRLMDDLLSDMQKLGFSLHETQTLFDLKMRSAEYIPGTARVLVIDCNPEALFVIADQIEQVRGAQVECRLLNDLSHIPGLMEDNPDIIVTTASHYEMVVQSAAREDRVCRVVLSPSQNTVAKLAKAQGGKVGILTASNRFAWIINQVCDELSPGTSKTPHLLFGSERTEDFLFTLDTLILPDYYARLCTQSDIEVIRAFAESDGNVIEFTYHIDAGSLMYLEQRIESVLENKENSKDL